MVATIVVLLAGGGIANFTVRPTAPMPCRSAPAFTLCPCRLLQHLVLRYHWLPAVRLQPGSRSAVPGKASETDALNHGTDAWAAT